jgi:hypothetical protein
VIGERAMVRLQDLLEKIVLQSYWPELGQMFGIPVPGHEHLSSVVVRDGEDIQKVLRERLKKAWGGHLESELNAGMATS